MKAIPKAFWGILRLVERIMLVVQKIVRDLMINYSGQSKGIELILLMF